MKTQHKVKLSKRLLISFLIVLLSCLAMPGSSLAAIDRSATFISFGNSSASMGRGGRNVNGLWESRKSTASTRLVLGRNGVVEESIHLAFPGATVVKTTEDGLLEKPYDLFVLDGDIKVQPLTINGSMNPEYLGEPNLAYVRFTVRLQKGVDENSIQVIESNSDYTTIPGKYEIAPVQEALFESFQPGLDRDTRTYSKSEEIYSDDSFFKYDMSYRVESLGGIKLIEITYSPFQYNPVTKQIQVKSAADLTVSYSVDSSIGRLETGFQRELDRVVDQVTVTSDADSATTQTDALMPSGNVFVIVSHANLINTQTYANYIDYRTAQGYVHLSTIDTSNPSYDEPYEISTALKSMYDGEGFDYLLLIGDENLVPISMEADNGVDYHDKNYCLLDGSDTLPDVFMGRYLASTETQFAHIFQHQIDQEQGGDWNKEVIMAWGLEIGELPFVGDRFSTSHYSTVIMDNPNGGLNYNVYRFYQLPPDKITAPTQYGGSSIGIPYKEFEPWTLIPNPFYPAYEREQCSNDITARWNEGVAVIGHRDHGSISGPASPSMTYAMFNGSIKNTCSPLFTSLNCLSGNYRNNHDTNFAYQSQSNEFGTCATYAATRTTFSGDNDFFHMAMYEAMFPNNGAQAAINVGQIFVSGMIAGLNHSRTYFHIFGDPMTNLSFAKALPSTGSTVSSQTSERGTRLILNGRRRQ